MMIPMNPRSGRSLPLQLQFYSTARQVKRVAQTQKSNQIKSNHAFSLPSKANCHRINPKKIEIHRKRVLKE